MISTFSSSGPLLRPRRRRAAAAAVVAASARRPLEIRRHVVARVSAPGESNNESVASDAARLWPDSEAAATASTSSSAAATTSPSPSNSTRRADAAPAPDLSYLEGKLAIVGVGARGAAAARALARDFPAISPPTSSPSSSPDDDAPGSPPPASSSRSPAPPRLWALDSDSAALAALTSSSSSPLTDDGAAPLPLATPVLLTAASSSTSAARLSPSAASALVAAVAGSDAGGRGNASAGDGGVAVVLGAACGTPGPAALVDVARAFSSSGALTAAAVAAPFGFEGLQSTRAAAAAISELSTSAAHVSAVVDQAVLASNPRASDGDGSVQPAVTMAEAAAIADAALAQCGRALLAALAAPDVLGVAAGSGAASWHARDAPSLSSKATATKKKNSRRALLLPPLAAALAPRGRSSLGRGSASVGSPSSSEVAPLIAALAADAVRAAAESPFLDAAASADRGPPASLVGVVFLPRIGDLSRAECRAAVQAAASAAADFFASSSPSEQGCAAFVYAPLILPQGSGGEEEQSDVFRVEVSLLATYPERQQATSSSSSSSSSLPEGVAAAIQEASAAKKKEGGRAARKEKAAATTPAAPPPPPPPTRPVVVAQTPFTTSPRDTARAPPHAVARSLDLPPAAAAWREARRAPAAPRVRYLPVGPDGGGSFGLSFFGLGGRKGGSRDGLDDDEIDGGVAGGRNSDEDDWESEGDDEEHEGGRGVLGALASFASLGKKGKRGSGSGSDSSPPAAAIRTRDRVAGMLERERDFGP